jgi:hypothetical protein
MRYRQFWYVQSYALGGFLSGRREAGYAYVDVSAAADKGMQQKRLCVFGK